MTYLMALKPGYVVLTQGTALPSAQQPYPAGPVRPALQVSGDVRDPGFCVDPGFPMLAADQKTLWDPQNRICRRSLDRAPSWGPRIG